MSKNKKKNHNSIDFDKIVYRGKKVIDFINELEPNVERILRTCRIQEKTPFNGSKANLKKWLINNQEGYNKYIAEVFDYFAQKCKVS